mmetsp:Transcript_28352/g.47663  ORF Transcript_28352/g.47663 Transcript_28352/m.47663 type:complete len:248 (+) Transcript_28352:273-1016(+)
MVFPSSLSVSLPSDGMRSNVSMQVLSGIASLAVHTCPVRAYGRTIAFPLSITEINRAHVISISTVCTCITASYPGVKMGRCSSISTSASCTLISRTAGQRLVGKLSTYPFWISSTPNGSFSSTFSPGLADRTRCSPMHTSSILVFFLVGIITTSSPTLMVPLSTFPSTIHPRSKYLSKQGSRKGPSAFLPSMRSASRVEISVGVVVLCPPLVYIFFHHAHLDSGTSSRTLSPDSPEMGTNFTSFLMT